MGGRRGEVVVAAAAKNSIEGEGKKDEEEEGKNAEMDTKYRLHNCYINTTTATMCTSAHYTTSTIVLCKHLLHQYDYYYYHVHTYKSTATKLQPCTIVF